MWVCLKHDISGMVGDECPHCATARLLQVHKERLISELSENNDNIEDKLEKIIQQVGEKEFIELLECMGYRLIDKEKFYDRKKRKAEV